MTPGIFAAARSPESTALVALPSFFSTTNLISSIVTDSPRYEAEISDEQRRDGFALVVASDGLAHERGDREHLDLSALDVADRDGIGQDHLLEGGLLDEVGGRAREHAVHAGRVDFH